MRRIRLPAVCEDALKQLKNGFFCGSTPSSTYGVMHMPVFGRLFRQGDSCRQDEGVIRSGFGQSRLRDSAPRSGCGLDGDHQK